MSGLCGQQAKNREETYGWIMRPTSQKQRRDVWVGCMANKPKTGKRRMGGLCGLWAAQSTHTKQLAAPQARRVMATGGEPNGQRSIRKRNTSALILGSGLRWLHI